MNLINQKHLRTRPGWIRDRRQKKGLKNAYLAHCHYLVGQPTRKQVLHNLNQKSWYFFLAVRRLHPLRRIGPIERKKRLPKKEEATLNLRVFKMFCRGLGCFLDGLKIIAWRSGDFQHKLCSEGALVLEIRLVLCWLVVSMISWWPMGWASDKQDSDPKLQSVANGHWRVRQFVQSDPGEDEDKKKNSKEWGGL